MVKYADMTVGEKREVSLERATARVTREDQPTFTVQRHFDGSWNTVVWVRADSRGWRVSREKGLVGVFFDDLELAVEEAIRRSAEALH